MPPSRMYLDALLVTAAILVGLVVCDLTDRGMIEKNAPAFVGTWGWADGVYKRVK